MTCSCKKIHQFEKLCVSIIDALNLWSLALKCLSHNEMHRKSESRNSFGPIRAGKELEWQKASGVIS